MNLRSVSNWLPFVVASLAALAAAPSQASFGGGHGVTCDDSINTIANDSYAGACQGPLAGAFGAADVAVFSGTSYGYVGATNDASGLFKAGAAPAQWGTLEFNTPVGGSFVVGLQGASSYSFYLFNGGSGVTALDFDSYGVSTANGVADTSVLRAGLFIAAVPEPASYGLMLAGVGGVAFMVRRRQRGSASSR